MELIKQIKETESKAKKLVEDAQRYADQAEEQVKQERADKFEEAGRQRKDAIAKSIEQGRAEGQKLAEEMMQKATQQQQQLKTSAGKRKDSAADKVIDFLSSNMTEKKQ